DVAGVFDHGYHEVDDLNRARNVPSLQLAGYLDYRNVDLNSLTDLGVRLIGRLVGIRDGVAQFSGSLANQAALSDLKMNRLLELIDAWAARNEVLGGVQPSQRFERTRVPALPPLSLDLRRGEIRSIVWATGFRPDYSWLEVPVFDR